MCGMATLHRSHTPLKVYKEDSQYGDLYEFEATITLDFGITDPPAQDMFSNRDTVYICRYHPRGFLELYQKDPKRGLKHIKLPVWLQPPQTPWEKALYSQVRVMQCERAIQDELVYSLPQDVVHIIANY